jgi:hypothetical protein
MALLQTLVSWQAHLFTYVADRVAYCQYSQPVLGILEHSLPSNPVLIPEITTFCVLSSLRYSQARSKKFALLTCDPLNLIFG